ncbi:MAG: FtsW/RodA/SpoVE family cell cycle protein [Oscillospiraceae bacterium]
MPDISEYIMTGAKYALPLLALWVLLRCVRSMLREKNEPETWAYFVSKDGEKSPICHWESIIGRAPSADVVVDNQAVSRVHASLIRDDVGGWSLSDIRSKGGTYVNGEEIGRDEPIDDGDELSFANAEYTFRDAGERELAAMQRLRTPPGRFVGPGVTLLILTLFQAFLTLEFTVTAAKGDVIGIVLAFFALIVAEWFCYLVTRSIRRTGFEPETLAFFLSTLGVSVVATGTPDEMLKQTLLLLIGISAFFLLGWILRDLGRAKTLRWLAAAGAIGLLALNLLTSQEVFGAKNWLSIAGVSLQPSELVKVAYIFTGAATLDRLFERRNLFGFIVFSAICVVALALMGDFGAAVIFFATFLVISFMRSGSFATLFLAVSGAGLAGFLVLSVKPYIAQRFASWGHVWEDVWGAGYQQTHTMAAAASGGLFGQGAGNGWLKDVVFANTDMVFGILCEELGLIIAVCAIFAVIALALFAVRNAAQGRSTYYVIAGCAAVSMLMVQLALNVFGSLDILPFTGVTFPFVSKGGTSLISCWMLLAFVKATDTRRDASFVVRPAAGHRVRPEEGDEDE